jgi:hypothetical protein
VAVHLLRGQDDVLGDGYFLPFRFALGNPFHAGVPWKGMEVGLKAMSGLMAK